MNKKLLIPIVFGVASAIILILTLTPISEKLILPNEKPTPIKILNSSYVNSNSEMKSSLALQKISMSNPLKFKGDAITKYCTFFENAEKQKSIEYCTSTELKDSDGNFIGNIHMVGNAEHPSAVLGVIQTDPFMSQLDSIKIIYQTMIESVVCDCWESQKPGNFKSVSDWIDAVKSHHLEGKQTTSKSQISGLAQKQLLIEITTNTKGYLWKFIITN